jgi:hypothetical protein
VTQRIVGAYLKLEAGGLAEAFVKEANGTEQCGIPRFDVHRRIFVYAKTAFGHLQESGFGHYLRHSGLLRCCAGGKQYRCRNYV